MNILMHFTCGTCKYEEPIGVDVRTGVVIVGSVVLICPRCGNITMVESVKAMIPVRFAGCERYDPPRHPPT